MKLNNLFHIFAIIFLFFIHACKQQDTKESPPNSLQITFSTDSTALELKGIPLNAMEELQSDSLPDSLWVNFFAVYEEPSDSEMRDFQPPLAGTYLIKNNIIQFKPNDSFKPDIAYFARSYTKMLLQDSEDLLSRRELFSSDGFIEYKFKIH